MATLFCTTAAEFQAALDVCVAGDIISLDHTKTFTANFIVRDRGVIADSNRIVIQSDTSADFLPADGYRIFPSYSPVLAKIQPLQVTAAQNIPAVIFAGGANGYTFKNLEFMPSLFGSGTIISIGNNDSAPQAGILPQTSYAQIPYNITLDRCYVHGHPISGQHFGILVCGDNVKILNSYVSDIKGVGQDCIPIPVLNCRGPLDITNCYIEGSTENFITGGTDPLIRTSATVLASVAPTTTEATLSTIADLSIGQWVAMHYTDGAVLRREFATVTAINTSTNRITWTPAVTAAPDVPGNVMWGVQFRGLTYRRNHASKQTRWLTPILTTPVLGVPVVTPAGSGLAAGTYYYVVTAIHDQIGYQQNLYHSDPSNERTVVVPSTSTVTTTWPAVPDASRYRVHRYQKDGSGNRINALYYATNLNTLTYTDTNAVGTSYTGYPVASNWIVKCLFELKSGVNVQIDSNVMEYHWNSANSTDCCVWLKNNNQNGLQPFSQTTDVVFEKNIMRHIHGFMTISDKRTTGEQPRDWPDNMRRITIRNNLVYDSDGVVWNSGGHTLTTFATVLQGGAKDVLWDHNTILHNAPDRGAIQVSTDPVGQGYQLNEIWRNSIYVHETYGLFSPFGQAKAGVDYITNNTGLFQKNVMADGTAAYNTFPATTNYIPTYTALLAEFKNAAANDYRLKRISEGDASNSTYINIGTDGADIGCNVALVLTATDGVIEGRPEGMAAEVATDRRLRWGRAERRQLGR